MPHAAAGKIRVEHLPERLALAPLRDHGHPAKYADR